MIWDVDNRHLQAVVILAEELNFTHAARRMGLTQSGFSRRIQAVEESVGAAMFVRNHAHVSLTDAGRAFVEEARKSLLHKDRAVLSARAAADGFTTRLRVGRSANTDHFVVSQMFSVRLPLYPDMHIEVHTKSVPELTDGLLTGKLDLALMSNTLPNRLLTFTSLFEAPLQVAFRSDDDLGRKSMLLISDLRGYDLILFERSLNPALHDAILRRFAEEGLIPRSVHQIFSSEEATHLVEQGMGVAFLTPGAGSQITRPELIMCPLNDGELQVGAHLACLAENRSRLLSEFVRSVAKTVSPLVGSLQMRLPIAG